VTGDDEVRGPARRALYRIGFAHAIQLRPWPEVRALGQRIQRRRIAALVVAVAALLTGAGAANALVARGAAPSGPPPGVTPATEATTTSTRPATATSTESAPSDLPTSPPASTPTFEPTTSTTEPALQPYEDGVQFTASTTAERGQVFVGDDVVLHATLHNTGTRAFHTEGYGSFGVACAPWPEGAAPDFFDMGAFIPEVVLQPGQTETFTITLTATDYVGTVFCGVGFAYHGDAFAAGPNRDDTGADAFVEITARPSTTPSTTVPATTSTTDASADA